MKILQKWLSLFCISLLLWVQLVNADDDTSKNGELWRDFWEKVSPIQVQIGWNEWSRYMLPTYATKDTIKNLAWCSVDLDAIENKPEWALRVNCPSLQNMKDLLAGLKISNFHTNYWPDLPDLYIPKYYVLEQEVKIDDPDSLTIDDNGKIIYQWASSVWWFWVAWWEKAWFGIYDADTSKLGGTLDWGDIYKLDINTPNIAIEAYQLDGSRLSPESLRSGIYTLEHYLTPNNQTDTFDGNSLFWTSNSLKYVLNQYTPKMEERVFRDVCSEPKSGVKLFKNDNYNYGWGLKFRKYITSGKRIDAINNGECETVHWLLASRDSLMQEDDVELAADEGTQEVKSGVAYFTNERITAISWADKKIMGIRSDRWDGTILNIWLTQKGIIWSTSHFENTDENAIKAYYDGKVVKLYYLIKLTYNYEKQSPADKWAGISLEDRNKYWAGLDPLNQHYWNSSINNSSSAEYRKYLYGPDNRGLLGNGNAYVMLGTAYQGSERPSTIYELSAPGYAQKASDIWGSASEDAAESRIKNMHLNISQGYQETDSKRARSDNEPNLYLMSRTRIVAPNYEGMPNVIVRNYDADMDNRNTPFSTKSLMENNLDYVLAYRGEDTYMPSMRNSAVWNGIININSANQFWAWWSTSSTPNPVNGCLNIGVQPGIFPNTYSLFSPCWQKWVVYAKQTMSWNSKKFWDSEWSMKYYQQIEGSIVKKHPNQVDSVNKGTFLQSVANMGDTEVFNQIYLNSNFMIGLPNKEEMVCEISLYKMPTVPWFDYKDKFDKQAILTGTWAGDYGTDANPFMPSVGSYVDKTIVDHILNKTRNEQAFSKYLDIHYGESSSGERQHWLTGEKGILSYNCKKNTSDMDEVVVMLTTSDEKYTFDNSSKQFVKSPSTDKLVAPLLDFNTGSTLSYNRVHSRNSDAPNSPNVANFNWPIKTYESEWFIKRTIGSEWNNETQVWDNYLGRKSSKTGLFRGGIEVFIPYGTGKDNYGKVDIVIYDKNRPGGVLDAKTYYISTPQAFPPGTPPELTPPPTTGGTPPNGYCTVIEQTVPYGANGGNINQCSVDSQWSVTNKVITLEESNVANNEVSYKIICWNSWDQEFKWSFTFDLNGLHRYGIRDEEGNYSIFPNIPWGNSYFLNNRWFTIKDFTIPGKSQWEIIVQVPLQERKVSCPDVPMKASATLKSSAEGGQAWLPSKTEEVQLLECKVPTIEIETTSVNDGNLRNDKNPNRWSSAYPFEFNQCGNNITYSIQAKYMCFDKDPEAKNVKVKFTRWDVIDWLNRWRNPFTAGQVSASSIWNVQPKFINENNIVKEIHWDLFESTYNFANYSNGGFSARVSVTPPVEGHMRIQNSFFEIEKTSNSKLKFDTKSKTANMNCGGEAWVGPCRSVMLTSDVALDPVIEKQTLYDRGIYRDDNKDESVVHREEIDGTSKKGTKDGESHYEPIRFETEVSNPEPNQSVYQMGNMVFDVNLNSKNEKHFEKVAPENTQYSNGSNLDIVRGNPVWHGINLPAGQKKGADGAFNIYADIKTGFSEWHPSLNFHDNDNPQCNYTIGFNPWKSTVTKNPITIDVFRYEETEQNSPMKDPEDPRKIIEQHLPGDKMRLVMDFTNNNNHILFRDTYVRVTFDKTGSGQLDDPSVDFDMTKIFKLEGTDDGEWKVSPTGDIKCKLGKEELYCMLTRPLEPLTTKNTLVFLSIDIESNFYKKLKTIDNTKDWKHFFPINTKEIVFGSPDLDKINEIVYYTSSEDQIPAGKKEDDIGINHLDFNVPELRKFNPSPKDSNFGFYVGIPYAVIENKFTNGSIGNFSPGDIGHFTTTLKNIGRASIKNPVIKQDLYHLGIQNDWVDTEIRKITITPSTDKTNIPEARTTDFFALNNDADPDNNVITKNQPYVTIEGAYQANDVFKDKDINNNPDFRYYTSTRPLLIEGSWDLSTGGSMEARTDIKFVKLKDNQFPQIDCKTEANCVRKNKNPKNEEFKGRLDLAYIGDDIDEEVTEPYKVHFPILKSILFAKTNNDFRPADGSNANIQGKLNSDDTTVTYRVDNFIPQEYTDYANEKVGKARDPYAYIRLPNGVKYVSNTLKKVDNIEDGTNDATANVVTPAGFEPEIREVSDYKIIAENNNTFENDFLTNSAWHKVTGTENSDYAIMKGVPFTLNIFNKSYNFYRVTNDGVLSLGYTTESANSNSQRFWESTYMDDKQYVKLTAINPAAITFNNSLNGIVVSAPTSGIRYTDENGEIKTANQWDNITVGAKSAIALKANESISINVKTGLTGVTYDKSLVKSENSVEYKVADSKLSEYAIIAPLMHRLDTSKKKEYGVYEKVEKDNNGKVTAVKYIWYGASVDNPTQEMKFGVNLYGGANYNSIRFTYGEMTGTIATDPYGVITGISQGGGTNDTMKISPYFDKKVRELSNANDILFSASPENVYQELKIPLGYTPDALDLVREPVIHPQEKDNTWMFIKWPGKDQTSQIFQFNVKISTNDTVCGEEYATSVGWSTLRLGKLHSTRSDREDIDQFCFSSKKPTIKILDNASYARGGYKSSNNNCTVNHLALMWFNSKAIWWNSNTNNGCWLTYNIQKYEKDLSIYTTSPYDLLGKYRDKTDTRPIDTSLITNNQHLGVEFMNDIQVSTSWQPNEALRNKYPNITITGLKMFTKNNFLVWWNYDGKSVILRTTNAWQLFTEVKKFDKNIVALSALEQNIIVIFADGTYIRSVSGGIWEWSEEWRLADFPGVTKVAILNNMKMFVLANNAVLYSSNDGGAIFNKRNLRVELGLNNNESLTSLDTHAGKEIWITTNLGNILYSNDSGDTFVKKTTGVTLDTELLNFDDSSVTYNSYNETWFTRTSNNNPNIDTIDNGKSVKLDNIARYFEWERLGRFIGTIPDTKIIDTSATYNLANYVENGIVRGNLYLTLILNDINQYEDIETIIFEQWSNRIEIMNPKQFNVDGSWTFKEGENTIMVPLTRDIENAKYAQRWNLTWQTTLKVSLKLKKGSGNTLVEPIYVGKLQMARLNNPNVKNKINPISGITFNQNAALWNQISTNDANYFDLSSYRKNDGTIDWFLSFDLYVSDPAILQNNPQFMLGSRRWAWYGNLTGTVIFKLFRQAQWWQPVYTIKWDTTTPGWKTIIIPLNRESFTNVAAYDTINWSNIALEVGAIYNAQNRYVKIAIDNIKYVSSASANLQDIKFFSSADWVAFGYNGVGSNNSFIKYNTFDNKTWALTEALSQYNNISQFSFIKLRGRELYGILNTNGKIVSTYSLDKWINTKVKELNITWQHAWFDMIDVDSGYMVDPNGKLYRVRLIND